MSDKSCCVDNPETSVVEKAIFWLVVKLVSWVVDKLVICDAAKLFIWRVNNELSCAVLKLLKYWYRIYDILCVLIATIWVVCKLFISEGTKLDNICDGVNMDICAVFFK